MPINVTNISPNSSGPFMENEDVQFTITVENTSSTFQQRSVNLLAGNSAQGELDVNLPGNTPPSEYQQTFTMPAVISDTSITVSAGEASTNVQVQNEDTTENISNLIVTNLSVSQVGPNEASANVTVSNVIESGDGEQLSGTLTVSLDGSQVASESVDLSPAGSQTSTFNLTGMSQGDRNVCAEVV
jgi:hypothetical protein